MPKLNNRTFREAKILFRNFAGMEKPMNSPGDRNFCLLLTPEEAKDMLLEGWNVKYLRPREEGDEPEPYVQVALNYEKGRPPRVVLITSNGRTELGADEVSILDVADILSMDVVLNPFSWTMGEKKGVKAYLKTAFVTLNEDELEREYAMAAQVPTSMDSIVSDD